MGRIYINNRTDMISGEKEAGNRILGKHRINLYHELFIPQHFYVFENMLYFLKNDCIFSPQNIFLFLENSEAKMVKYNNI